MPHLDDDQLESLLRQTKPELQPFSTQKKRQLRTQLLNQLAQKKEQRNGFVLWQRALGVVGALTLLIVPAYFWLVQTTLQNGGTVASFIPVGRWMNEEPTAVYPTPTPAPNIIVEGEQLAPPHLHPSFTEQGYPPPTPSHSSPILGVGYPSSIPAPMADIWIKNLRTEDDMFLLELGYQLPESQMSTEQSVVGYIELSTAWGNNGRYIAQHPIEQGTSTLSAKLDMVSWQAGDPITIDAHLFMGQPEEARLVATAVPYEARASQLLWLHQQHTLEPADETYSVELLFGYQQPSTYASVEFQLKSNQAVIARQTHTSAIGLLHLPLILPQTDLSTPLVVELYGQTATGERILLETVFWSVDQ